MRTIARAIRLILRLSLVPIAMALILLAILHVFATRSLPIVEGERPVDGIVAPAVIQRDETGIAVIRAESVDDAFLAQGYVHAQERFPQMDLARRYVSGRLSELFGERSAPLDTAQRRFGFDHVARGIAENMTDEHRAMLESYTKGVNAGLRDLRSPHPLYTVLRANPEPWSIEDSVRVSLFMHSGLAFGARTERSINAMDDALHPQLVRFLTPHVTANDAPVVGSDSIEPPRIPGPAETTSTAPAQDVLAIPNELGSNGWVAHGDKTADGRAILANDMHLGLSVPNIWHRAEIRTTDMTLLGVSLAGVPGIVVGTNTHVAWGFTNVMGDFQDLVRLRINPDDRREYRTPEGFERFETRKETIEVRGGESRELTIRTTRWGPVVDQLHDGTSVALAWPALNARTNNLQLLELFDDRNTDDALETVGGWFGPPQNVMLADRHGNIAWTISGYLPKRRGFTGKRSVDWSEPGVGWVEGEQTERPAVTNPEEGFIATANARTIPVEQANKIGTNWGDPVRQRRINDLLKAGDRFSERNMFRVQLDTDVSTSYGVVQEAFLDAVPESTDDDALRRAREMVERWNGRADTDQPGMTIVSRYRGSLSRELFRALTAPCREVDPGFYYTWFQSGEVIHRLLRTRPDHMLPPGYDDWDEMLRELAVKTTETLGVGTKTDDQLRWGQNNRAFISHPIAETLPALGSLLNAPRDPMPGHNKAVRAQSRFFGASQRLVVSPGRERDAILHMPTGQVMHPLSEHRMDMHEDWVAGAPTPLRAGPPRDSLTLVSPDNE